MKANEFEREMKELLASVGADGYEKTGLKYRGATVYVATFEKNVCIGLPWFILEEEGDLWIADDVETEKIAKKYLN